jgi:uroporphyrin-III C-methyltransferase
MTRGSVATLADALATGAGSAPALILYGPLMEDA